MQGWGSRPLSTFSPAQRHWFQTFYLQLCPHLRMLKMWETEMLHKLSNTAEHFKWLYKSQNTSGRAVSGPQAMQTRQSRSVFLKFCNSFSLLNCSLPVWIINDASIYPLFQDFKVRHAGCLGQIQAQLLGLAVPRVIESLVMEQAQGWSSHALTLIHRSSWNLKIPM